MRALPLSDDDTLKQFLAAAHAGQTIALVITKDPEAAVAYYFRNALRAFEAYERLDRLNASPIVVYVSPEDGAHRPAAQMHSASALALRSICWFARLVSRAGGSEP